MMNKYLARKRRETWKMRLNTIGIEIKGQQMKAEVRH